MFKMDQHDQINSVIVKITMDGTESAPRFIVQEVTAQPGRCFDGAENLHRARFECLCCKTGYVVLPLIMQTAPIRTEMEVSIAKNDPTPIEEIAEHDPESETGITLDEVVDSDEEKKPDDEFDDVKMEPELLLPEDSFEMAPLDHQVRVGQMTDLEEGDFGRTPSDRPLHEVVNSDEDVGHDDSEMEADMTFPIDIDQDSIEKPIVKQQFRVGQTSKVKESDVLTLSEERSLKLQCLRSKLGSKVVIRLDRVDVEAREEGASVAPVKSQERNVEKLFYQCDICQASMKYRCLLISHMNIHLGIRFSCSRCQASFNRESHLTEHKKRIHQSELRICEVCNQSKTCTKAEYHLHLRRQHPEFHIKGRRSKVQNFNGVDFPCVYCEPQATFTSFRELKDHLRVTHDRSFACTRCPKAFNERSSLKRHIESVHEKKKFKCPKCDKVFTWRTNLYAHLHNHK